MKLIYYIVFLFLVYTQSLFAQEYSVVEFNRSPIIQLANWKLYPDSSSTHNIDKIPNGNYTLTKHIVLDSTLNSKEVLCLSFFNLPSAFKIYWDSTFIGNNGEVGRDELSERPGKVRYDILIPPKLIYYGEHTIEIQVSNYRANSMVYGSWIQIGYQSEIESLSNNETNEQAIYIGLFFTAALFCFSVFIGGWKHSSFLFFAGYTSSFLQATLSFIS